MTPETGPAPSRSAASGMTADAERVLASMDVLEAGPTVQQVLFTKYVVPEIEVMTRVARAMTTQKADAEDLVQEALIRAYNAIEKFDGRHPRAWLLTIVRNTEYNRHRKRRPFLLDDADDISKHDSPTASTPEEQLVDRTLDDFVETAYKALPDKYRDAVRLVDIEGLSYAEAAAVLDTPVGTIMSRLHRGRKAIRNRLLSDGFARNRGKS